MRATLISLLAVVSLAGCRLLDVDRVPVAVDVEPGMLADDRPGQVGEVWSTVLGPAEMLVLDWENRLAGKQLYIYSDIEDSPECSAWEEWEWPFFRHVADTTLMRLWGAWVSRPTFMHSKGLIPVGDGRYSTFYGRMYLEFFPDGRCVQALVDGCLARYGGKDTPLHAEWSRPAAFSGETTYSLCGRWLMLDKETMPIEGTDHGYLGLTNYLIKTTNRLFVGGMDPRPWRLEDQMLPFDRVLPTYIEE